MRQQWARALALSLLLLTAVVVLAQNTAAVRESAAGQTKKGKLISLGTTSLESPKTTPKAAAVQASPRQMINERALMKLMYRANATLLTFRVTEKAKASTNAKVGFGGSAFTVDGLDNADNRDVNGGDLEPPDQGFCAG